MTSRREIVEAIAKRTDLNLNQQEIDSIVVDFIDIIKEELIKGNEVSMRGFGNFRLVTRKAKLVRDISRGTSMMYPEHTIPHFLASPKFKEDVINANKDKSRTE